MRNNARDYFFEGFGRVDGYACHDRGVVEFCYCGSVKETNFGEKNRENWFVSFLNVA